jgi:hypothetical protein
MFAWLRKLIAPRKGTRADPPAPAISIPPNAERVPLTLADEGHMFLRMRVANPQMTDLELANRIGKTPGYVSRAIHAALIAPVDR